MKKKLLILSYYWPPASGPGVQRILKFAKYLEEFGWQIWVVTPQDGSYPFTDEKLESDVPPSIQVVRTKTSDPFRAYNFLKGKKGKSIPVAVMNDKSKQSVVDKLSKYVRANFFIPDARVGWNKFALQAAHNIIKNNSIEHIITTGPPQSTHLQGLELKKQNGINWIADFRDPWTKAFTNESLPRSKKTIRKDEALERSVLGAADVVTTVSEGLANDLEKGGANVAVIPNGFDEEDMPSNSFEQFQSEKFVLSYIGNFKASQNISSLWRALSELIIENKAFREYLRINLVGKVSDDVLLNIKENGLVDRLNNIGMLTHLDAVKEMLNTNLLLFIIPNAKNNKVIITGKIFEYLATKNPILSIGPTDGDAAKVLDEVGRKKMIDYEDVVSIKRQVLEEFNLWIEDKTTVRFSDSNHLKYSRKELTKKLDQLLTGL